MAMAAEGGAASEPELVSIPATPHGLSTPEGAATPTGASAGGGGGRSKGSGTPGRRVVEGLRGYLEDVGHLTRLDLRDAWLPVTESRGGYAPLRRLSLPQRRPRLPGAPPPARLPGPRMVSKRSLLLPTSILHPCVANHPLLPLVPPMD